MLEIRYMFSLQKVFKFLSRWSQEMTTGGGKNIFLDVGTQLKDIFDDRDGNK